MNPLLHFSLVCIASLSFTLACLRAGGTNPSSNANDDSASSVALSDSPIFNETVQQDDATLAATRRMDAELRDASATTKLTPIEHMRRAAVYIANRAFDEARAHWQALIADYPHDANVPAALFGIGRSFYQQRRYTEALPFFERLGKDYAQTREGRDGFYYVAPTLLRSGHPLEAAARYREYTEKFPFGERIEDAYLNVIDSFREAGRIEDALAWVDKTRSRFPNGTGATRALFARLRLEVAEQNWSKAIADCDELARQTFTRDTASTTPYEVAYLRAYSLERSGRAAEAIAAYDAIPDTATSFYGSLATKRLENISGNEARDAKRLAAARMARARRDIYANAAQFPAAFRAEVLRGAQAFNIDPRFVLATMKQESGFRPRAKSNAAARGLMQLTFDTALVYAARAGYPNLRENDLYDPATNVKISCAYFADLIKQFPDMLEPVAASYNGGEDNAARWLARSKSRDAGMFTAEVGYSETKDYVYKVMTNYRAYKQLYDAQLRPQR